jgi:hypothetical protein
VFVYKGDFAMTIDELKQQAINGDVILICKPKEEMWEIVAEQTGGEYYHVGLLEQGPNDALLVNEMSLNGFRTVTIEQRLADTDGQLCYGKAPEIIRMQPQAVSAAVSHFEDDSRNLPYGYSTLLKVWLSDNFGTEFDPEKEQPVCSVFVQRIWAEVLAGNFEQLWSPNDVAKKCQSIQPVKGA